MTRDTRAEILIVAGVAVLLLFLWHRNRANGAGTGADILLPNSANGPTSNGGVPLKLTMPTSAILSPWEPPAITAPNYGGVTLSLASPSDCGCGGGAFGNTYGSGSDLAAALISQGFTGNPNLTQEDVY